MENDNDGDSNSNKTKFNTNTNTTNNMDYLTGTPNFGHDSYGAADYWHPNHNHAAPFSQQEAEACPTDGGQHKQAPVFTFTGTAVENYPPFPAAATGTSLASTPNLAPAQQDVPASSSFTNPPSKRQRRSSTGIGDRGRAAATGFREEDPDSRCGTPSECCSNCRGGEACDEPDCSPCDDLDCAAEDDEEVEICNEKSCSKPACREGCFSIAFQNHTSLCDRDAAQESSVPLTGALGNAQIAHRGMKPSRMTMVPARFESSPATTPSMAGNSEASPSPYPALPTPYADPGSGEMSGTGSLISTPEPWGDATYGSMNNGSGQDSLPCLWEGCDYVGLNHNEWSIHFHMNHIDTQMSFACPIPAGNCPATIDTNPMNHLQDFHDFNWDFGNFPALCPATSCPPDQTFLSPEMLHNHFDSAHATPVQGSLQCRLQTCGNTVFDDPDQFISHMQFHLQAPISRNEEDVALLVAPDPATTKAGDKTEACKAISIPHMCMWKSKDGELCNFEGKDPSNLQDHVKEQHLSTLGKSTGYLCQWDSCRRDANLGEKSGFSQRGKLERHMATHTGFKCSECPICHQQFSAPQALRQHILLHTGEKPWKCKHCDKRFPQQSACTIHERTHTNEKPLECNICGKKFSESSNLAKHRKIHGEKGLHACPVANCGKSFHRLDQLKRHAQTHDKPPKDGTKRRVPRKKPKGGVPTLSKLESQAKAASPASSR